VRILIDPKLTNTDGLVQAMRDAGHSARMLGVVHDDFTEFLPEMFLVSESRAAERAIQKCLGKCPSHVVPDKFFNQYVEYVADPEAIGSKSSLQNMREYGCDIVYVGEYDELIEAALTRAIDKGLHVKVFSAQKWKIPENLGWLYKKEVPTAINYANAVISREDGWQRFLGHSLETTALNLDLEPYTLAPTLLFKDYVTKLENDLKDIHRT
jgi:hypothetical protein